MALDLETTGLDPRSGRIRLLSLSTDTIDGSRFSYLVDCFAVDPRPLFPLLADQPIIGHNLLFDLGFLGQLGFDPGPVADTMLLSQLLSAGLREPHKLPDVAQRHLGRTVTKDEQLSDWSRPDLSAAQLRYAAADVEILPPLYDALLAKIKAADLERVADIESRCLPAVYWLARSGCPVNAEGWSALATSAAVEAEELAKQLDAAAPPPEQRDFTGGGWNWDSPQQVQVVFKALGIDLESTADEALAAVNHPLADLLRRYRAARKRCTAYGTDFLSHVAADGRIYASWRQLGADSGRFSCREPNLQQLPRGKEYRRCVAPAAGRVLVKADYSQIELRIAAKISGDKAMLDAYQQNLDLHTLTARRILGTTDIAKSDRQLAKAVNFGLLYGMGAKGFQIYAKSNYCVELTAGEAVRYRDAFFRAYPGLASWHRKVKSANPKETRTLAGRRRLFPQPRFTEQVNTPVQGTGADGLKRALALCWERRQEVPSAFLVLAVHDEIVMECEADQAEVVSDWLKQAMLDGMTPLVAPVPIEVEVTIAPTWGG